LRPDFLSQLLKKITNETYAPIVFTILNLVRDSNYNLLPSFTYKESEEATKMELSFYELKELKKTMTQQGLDGYALTANNDFFNDYGDLNLSNDIQKTVVKVGFAQ